MKFLITLDVTADESKSRWLQFIYLLLWAERILLKEEMNLYLNLHPFCPVSSGVLEANRDTWKVCISIQSSPARVSPQGSYWNLQELI